MLKFRLYQTVELSTIISTLKKLSHSSKALTTGALNVHLKLGLIDGNSIDTQLSRNTTVVEKVSTLKVLCLSHAPQHEGSIR